MPEVCNSLGMNSMIAIDTNILVYAMDHDEPLKQRLAIELLCGGPQKLDQEIR